MSPWRAVLEVARWTWVKTIRRPVVLSFSLLQPLLWMLFFGFLFQRFELGGELEGVRYLDFLVAGVCAMTVLFGASQSGVTFIRDMQTGFFERLMRTPTLPGWVLLGKVIADTARLLIQAIAVLLLALLLGAEIALSPLPLLLGLVALCLFGFAWCSLSTLIAQVARIPERMATFVHVVNMPLLFTSTALVPARDMPSWLAGVARWNPLSLAVELLRAATLDSFTLSGVAPALLPLALMGGVLFTASALLASRPTTP